MSDDIPHTFDIQAFMHCALCQDSKPSNISPTEWSQLDVGVSSRGIQVWCRRHKCNVAHIDFEGHEHPINVGTHLPTDPKKTN